MPPQDGSHGGASPRRRVHSSLDLGAGDEASPDRFRPQRPELLQGHSITADDGRMPYPLELRDPL